MALAIFPLDHSGPLARKAESLARISGLCDLETSAFFVPLVSWASSRSVGGSDEVCMVFVGLTGH